MAFNIIELTDEASRALAYDATYNADDTLRHVIQKKPAAIRRLKLRELTLPKLDKGNGDTKTFVPVGTQSAKESRLDVVIANESRTVKAGAHLVVVEEIKATAQTQNGLIALRQTNSGFVVAEPARFAHLQDGHEMETSALPVFRANVDRETIPAYGVRFTLSRRDVKQYFDGQLSELALTSIGTGIARALDGILLEGILSTNPQNFTLAAAAAYGLSIDELRAVVGTSGNGAGFRGDGVFAASGIPAELAPNVSETVAGAYNRCAIALHEDITLLAERINANGELNLTAFFNAQALIPTPGAFWTVGA